MGLAAIPDHGKLCAEQRQVRVLAVRDLQARREYHHELFGQYPIANQAIFTMHGLAGDGQVDPAIDQRGAYVERQARLQFQLGYSRH
ncbi:Uncharacterised protein [Bordetella pertussis]|nr:Uncharacterised protein [Bordetella pertussis]CPK86594.1 Uncharacterised protein [Bordetella pertussis]